MSSNRVTMGETFSMNTGRMTSRRPFANMTREAPNFNGPTMAMDAMPRRPMTGGRARDAAGVGPMPDEDQTISSENYKTLMNLLSETLEPEDLERIRSLIETPNSDDDTDKTLAAMDSNSPALQEWWRGMPTSFRADYAFDVGRYLADAPRRRKQARMIEEARARHAGGFNVGSSSGAQESAATARETMFPNANRLNK